MVVRSSFSSWYCGTPPRAIIYQSFCLSCDRLDATVSSNHGSRRPRRVVIVSSNCAVIVLRSSCLVSAKSVNRQQLVTNTKFWWVTISMVKQNPSSGHLILKKKTLLLCLDVWARVDYWALLFFIYSPCYYIYSVVWTSYCLDWGILIMVTIINNYVIY